MKIQLPTEFPFGYDDKTTLTLTPDNQLVITHPVMPPMIYDESVMRWVELSEEVKP
jgi:hypothetical protein